MSLFRSISVVGGMTLLSRFLGLFRDIVFAHFIGAGRLMDAFIVAFKVPNTFRRMTGEGAFSQAFVPVVSDHRESRSHEEVKDLVDHVSGTFGALLALFTLIGVVAAPVFVLMFAPGYLDDGGKFDLTVELLRFTFPYMFFISLVAFAGGVLNTYDRFGVPAFTPVLLNLVLIAAAAWVAPRFPDHMGLVLAGGVFLAGLVQLLLQLPFLAALRLLPRPRFDLKHPGVRRIGVLMLPALFGASVAQLNLLVDTLIASFIPADGPISWLYYSDRLMEFPLGVFAIALGTVLLPNLSRRHARADADGFSDTLDWGLKMLVLFGLPAAVGLFMLAAPAIITLFRTGVFSADSAIMASYSLMAYSAGLLGFMGVKVLAPGFFSRQDTRTPVKIGVVAMLVNLVLNLLIAVPMIRYGLTAPHAGLAAATSVAAFVNAGLLLAYLRRQGHYRAGAGWYRTLMQAVVGCLVMALVLWHFTGPVAWWLEVGTWTRVLRLLGLIAGGGVLYLATLYATGLRPAQLAGPTGGEGSAN